MMISWIVSGSVTIMTQTQLQTGEYRTRNRDFFEPPSSRGEHQKCRHCQF